ncbi:MAG: hypothetical protein IKJ73_09055 [Lachnospiraceae bacterium]|nr:hypothetical protein [Lachnospiraceae bacterium]
MINLVPSKQVSEYLDDIGYKFTDFQRATLIWNAAECSRAEKLSALEDLSLTTEDPLLKQQIKERLRYELMMLADFKENANGEFVYVVEDKDGIHIGYFEKASMAMSFASDRKENCSILKYLLVKDNKLPPLSEYKDLYHKFINSETEEQDVGKYLDLAVAGVEIDEKGNVESLWCDNKMDYAIPELSTERFENQFINIPFPETFTRGIPVKLVTTGEYGIIAQGSEMWDKFIEKFGDGKELDYIDMSLTVVFITEDGMWSHEHINPIYLEVEMPKTKDNPELAYALEALSDYWSGSGSEEIVLKYSRQYADSKKKPRKVDLATTVQDIII